MRAIAVLLVMASHYINNFSYWFGLRPNHALFYTGDVGIALFFALSGYLIGGILLGITDRGGSGQMLLRFWVRRWMRTLPVYWLWLGVLLVTVPPDGDKLNYFAHFATMTQNVWRPMPPNYWFSVSWSLPIEEWFYFLFGAAAVLAAGRGRGSRAVWLPVAGFLLVPMLLRVIDSQYPVWEGGHAKMVPFRLDGIAYGVVMVAMHRAGSALFRYRKACLTFGLTVLFGEFVLEWAQIMILPLRASVVLEPSITMLGCALCLPAAATVRILPGWLASAARVVSRQSYALYLVHVTILVDLVQGYWWTHRDTTLAAVVVALVLPFLVAEALSRLVEQPIMRLRPSQFPVKPGDYEQRPSRLPDAALQP